MDSEVPEEEEYTESGEPLVGSWPANSPEDVVCFVADPPQEHRSVYPGGVRCDDHEECCRLAKEASGDVFVRQRAAQLVGGVGES